MTIYSNLSLFSCLCNTSVFPGPPTLKLSVLFRFLFCGRHLSPPRNLSHNSLALVPVPLLFLFWRSLRASFQVVAILMCTALAHGLEEEIGCWMLPASTHRNNKIAPPKTDCERDSDSICQGGTARCARLHWSGGEKPGVAARCILTPTSIALQCSTQVGAHI